MSGISRTEKIFSWLQRVSVVAVLLLFAAPASELVHAKTADEDSEVDESASQSEEQSKELTVPLQQVPAASSQPTLPAAVVPVQPTTPQQENAVPATQAPPPPAQPAPPAAAVPVQPATPQQEKTIPATQEPPVIYIAPAAQPAQPARPTAAPPARPGVKPKSADVSFNFDDADVFSVVQTIFGDILKVNYIIDPQVKGRVTYRSVAPIPRDNILPLMEVILRMNGIAVVEDAGLYRIIPMADISREPARMDVGRDPGQIQVTGKAVIQVVPIRYVTSTEVVKVLTPFLSASAQIIDAPKSNHIVIIDTASNVKRLLGFVDLFDSEQLRRIRPQVYVYSVQNSKAKDVVNILNQIFLGGKSSGTARSATVTKPAAPAPGQPVQPAQPQAAPETAGVPTGDSLVSDVTRIFADEIANTVIILATRGDYELIEETIKKIDTLPRQVVIEGLIALVTLTDNLTMGLAWSLQTDVNFSLKPFTKDFDLSGSMGSNAPLPNATGLSRSGFSFVATDASGIVRARLEALATESKAKVLAAPHILVTDNREARIQVGQQVPLVTSSTNVTGTTDIQRTVQYKDIGIILKVKPQVNDSGLVSMEITQEVSSLGNSITIGSDSAPTLNKTEASTNLVAQDGQTIIIGGLIRDDKSKNTSGIPFLSKIPLIGWLFGDWSDVDSRTELVILLTPRVIRTQAEAAGVTNDYVNKYKGMDKDLQQRLDGQKTP
jgi:type II secretory pathway component GspD/PulD (secretin)